MSIPLVPCATRKKSVSFKNSMTFLSRTHHKISTCHLSRQLINQWRVHVCKYLHTHTHIHTHTQAHTHTHTHTNVHTHTHSHSHSHSHTHALYLPRMIAPLCIPMRIFYRSLTYVSLGHTRTHTHTRTDTHILILTHTRTLLTSHDRLTVHP